MFKVGILSLYFGQFPNYFPLWLRSCASNPSFDFLLVTDQEIESSIENVHIIKTDFSAVKKRFENVLKASIAMEQPYKLCDFKPMYGLAFEDELKEYDFWGHCDMDLIWGNLQKFITPEVLEKFDKILPLGHLSLYRNTKRINEAFKLSGSRRGSYREVISIQKSCVFDERYGINKIFETNLLPLYDKEVAADIDFRNERMLIAGTQNINYPLQLFYINHGKCLRAYVDHEEIKYDEFAYIHLQKRAYTNIIDDDAYIIGRHQFFPLQPITKELIQQINPYPGKLYEMIEYFYKDYKFRINRRIKQLLIE